MDGCKKKKDDIVNKGLLRWTSINVVAVASPLTYE